MSLAHAPLPYDILAQIVSWAPRSTWTTLCLVSRDFHHLATPRLYRVADFKDEEAARAYQFLQVISSSPTLGSFVHRLSVIDAPVDALLHIRAALHNMPNLQHFCFKRLGSIIMRIPAVRDALASLPALRSLDTTYSSKYNWNGLLDRLPPLQSLTVDADGDDLGALERLLLRSRDTLQFLDTHAYWDLEAFLQHRAHGAVWPRMAELRLYSLESPAPAAAFPNLETLHISGRSTSQALEILCDASVLPRLRRLSISIIDIASPICPAVQPGRHLAHLHVVVRSDRDLAQESLLNFLAAFSSGPHLQSLKLELTGSTGDDDDHEALLNHVLPALPTLLAGCSQLQFLAVSHVCWGQPLRVDAMADFSPVRVPDTLLVRLNETLASATVQLPKLQYLILSVNWKLEEDEVASIVDSIERKLDQLEVFDRAPALRIVQCQLTEQELSWTRPSRSFDFLSMGREREPVEKLPTGLTDVVQFLEDEFEWYCNNS